MTKLVMSIANGSGIFSVSLNIIKFSLSSNVSNLSLMLLRLEIPYFSANLSEMYRVTGTPKEAASASASFSYIGSDLHIKNSFSFFTFTEKTSFAFPIMHTNAVDFHSFIRSFLF